MAQLIWSPRAIRDLQEACDYIARNSERYAHLFAEEVMAMVESIPQQPYLGAMVPEYDQENLRERQCHNYRVIYRLRGDWIEVVSIHHGARPLPQLPPR